MLPFLIFLFSIECFASIGKVTLVKGEVWAVRGQNKHTLALNDNLYSDDEIISQNRSLLKVTLNDETSIIIGPHSHFHFTDVRLNKKGEGRSTYDITYGFIRAKFVRKKKEGEVTFKTKNVAMGVRGTEFIIEVHDKDGKSHSKIALLRGKVDVEAFHPDKKKSHTFKLKKDHHFNSHTFEAKGIKHAHKKIQKKHLKGLNKNTAYFLHDVRHKGKAYPKYKIPKKFHKLKHVIRKNKGSQKRNKDLKTSKEKRKDIIEKGNRNIKQIQKKNNYKKNTRHKQTQKKQRRRKKRQGVREGERKL